MAISIHLKKCCITLAIACLCHSSVCTAAETSDENSQLPIEDIQRFATVFGAIKQYYVDDVTDKKLIESAIKGMVSSLDPHSNYLDMKAFKDMEESTVGEFGGLGIEITKDPAGVRVVSPIDDTPAAKAGIRAGDIIVKIDGKSVSGMSLNASVKLMRGKPKTKIVLTIARKGVEKPLVFNIVRDMIKIKSVKFKELDHGLGYIRISQFQERTTEDVCKAIIELHRKSHLKGLVLDLRNNPGGLLNSAIGVSAAFLPHDTLVVSTRGRNAQTERKFLATFRDYATGRNMKDPISELPDESQRVPIVVLINSASASASEIVSGALKDHKRATIMGTRSFGKGSVQTILPMSYKKDETTGIKITTARYYTPAGLTIQAKGITPDVSVDDTPEGNYPSFHVRESELDNHIEVTDAKNSQSESQTEEEQEEFDKDYEAPKLQYMFGDEKDFPLEQAMNYLLNKKVITHADVQARIKQAKAQRDSKKDSSK